MDGAAPVGSHSFDLAGIHRQAAIDHIFSIPEWPRSFVEDIPSRSESWAWRETRRGESWATRWLNDRWEHVVLRPNQDILALLRLSRRMASDYVHLVLHLGNGVCFFHLFCSESESIFRFHVRWLLLVVDFPDHSILVNWHSAEWAEL